MAFLDIARDML